SIGRINVPLAESGTRSLLTRPSLTYRQHFPSRPDALARATLHIALEIDGTVLAGEMDVALRHLLVAREESVLPDLPTGVTAQFVWIARWVAQRRQSRVVRRDPRP